MAFNSLIPLATDEESQSQAQLLGNFTELDTFLTVNHTAFNTADQGKHRFVTFPLQTVVPAPGPTQFPPATSATEFSIYNAVNGAGSRALWLRKTNLAGVITGDIDFTTVTTSAGLYGPEITWRLPCGIYHKFGWAVADAANPTVYVTPFPTATLSVHLTMRVHGAASQKFVQVLDDATLLKTGFSTRAFTVNQNPSTANVFFFAIGN
jgi:hypothetical protein